MHKFPHIRTIRLVELILHSILILKGFDISMYSFLLVSKTIYIIIKVINQKFITKAIILFEFFLSSKYITGIDILIY